MVLLKRNCGWSLGYQGNDWPLAPSTSFILVFLVTIDLLVRWISGRMTGPQTNKLCYSSKLPIYHHCGPYFFVMSQCAMFSLVRTGGLPRGPYTGELLLIFSSKTFCFMPGCWGRPDSQYNETYKPNHVCPVLQSLQPKSSSAQTLTQGYTQSMIIKHNCSVKCDQRVNNHWRFQTLVNPHTTLTDTYSSCELGSILLYW